MDRTPSSASMHFAAESVMLDPARHSIVSAECSSGFRDEDIDSTIRVWDLPAILKGIE
jgi:hypothetical protein